MARVAIVGGGYVGLTTAVALAEGGHHVSIVERDVEKACQISAGHPPFHEPGLKAALSRCIRTGRLVATPDLLAGTRSARFVLLCVGTPSRPDGSIDLSMVEAATQDVARAVAGAKTPPLLVIKSTVTPGTTRDRLFPLARRFWKDARVAVNPEFLREGSALKDARRPDRIVIGAFSTKDAQALKRLYGDVKGSVFVADPTTAEMVKYASNAFLATKITFANEMANLCEPLGVDWYDVIEPVGADRRIGAAFLRAGAGFGGSCFPKDVKALSAEAASRQRPSRLLFAVLEANEAQALRAVELLRGELGDLRGKKVALLGLAFKPDTDDVRETRALPIWKALMSAGADVVCHDSMAGENFLRLAPGANVVPDVKKALAGADGCILQTEWPAYRALRAKDFGSAVLVDARRAVDADVLERSAVRLVQIGRGRE